MRSFSVGSTTRLCETLISNSSGGLETAGGERSKELSNKIHKIQHDRIEHLLPKLTDMESGTKKSIS